MICGRKTEKIIEMSHGEIKAYIVISPKTHKQSLISNEDHYNKYYSDCVQRLSERLLL